MPASWPSFSTKNNQITKGTSMKKFLIYTEMSMSEVMTIVIGFHIV